MKHLFVGDITDYLSNQAKKFDSQARLVTEETLPEFLLESNGTYYASLGDFSIAKSFCQVLASSNEITYCPPPDSIWSDQDLAPDPRFSMETETKEHLYQWSYINRRPVFGLDVPDFLDPVVDKMLKSGQRASDDKQIWNFGCSITVGVGVTDDQTYGQLLSKRLELPISKVAFEGSSIRWASDQILSSDIKQGDVVIWGLTSINRFGYFLHDRRYYHVLASFLDDYPLMKDLFEPDILISPDLAYEALRSILTANNFCRKIGAHLIIVGVMPGYPLNKQIKQYENFIATDCKFKDLGSDGLHPGPQHHQFYTARVLDYMKQQRLI